MMGKRHYNLGDPEVKIALTQIFRTEDGKVLKSLLKSVVETIAPRDIGSCALHDLNGWRSLARNLIELDTQDTQVDDADTPKPVTTDASAGPGRSVRRGPAAHLIADARPGRRP